MASEQDFMLRADTVLGPLSRMHGAYDELLPRIARALSRAAAEARREALEEAAALAGRYAQRCERCPYPESCRHSGGRDVASYIRELKDRA